MASFPSFLLPLLLLVTLFCKPALCYINPSAPGSQQDIAEEVSTYHTYIVLVEPPSSITGEDAHRRWHESFLQSSRADESGESRLLHSYTEVISGFAARLTRAELDAVAKKPGFVHAFPSRKLQLMTTHTPEFLGLRNGTGVWSDSSYGKGVIIGFLDTGLHATHPSFDDHGVPPPPARWKGSCKAARCNNKLIGARSLLGGDDFGDEVGHGTHTSSTAAGNFVPGVSYHGVGTGTATGIAPGAHVAMYKVCDADGCADSDILAGLDMAIKDGVDVLSISLGGAPSFYDLDIIAIGTFSVVAKGIIVVCSAGNGGPGAGNLVNDAPWLLTVAAGSLDRSFGAEVRLGNGKTLHGEALIQEGKTSSKSYPLVFSKEHRYCEYHNISSIAGKIVVCEEDVMSKNQKTHVRNIMGAGAAGVVLFNDEISGYTTQLRDYNSSVVQVVAADGAILTSYATTSSEGRSMAAITYNNTLLGVRPAPVVAWFSSRGPGIMNDVGVLKPDILAPGLNILAAWPPKTDSALGPFNILSGTSMAAPHISGVAALIKSIHPNWSPAAIKSAILTTSYIVNSTGGSILNRKHMKAGLYDVGAGHVNPTRAADPGLVYDLSIKDYAGHICSLYPDTQQRIVRNASLSCAMVPKVTGMQLNYPTITAPLRSTPFTVNRTVTNVGPATSTYRAMVDVPNRLVVHVFPETLTFSKAGEKKMFSLTVSGHVVGKEYYLEGSLSWVSEKHVVRSPIIARTDLK